MQTKATRRTLWLLLAALLIPGVAIPRPALAQGGFAQLDYPGAAYTGASGVNVGGDIVGYHHTGDVDHGMLLRGGVFSSIDVPGWDGATSGLADRINDDGVIVGQYHANGAYHGFMLAGDPSSPADYSSIDVPGAGDTAAAGINNHGDIVGYYNLHAGTLPHHGFLLSRGVFTTLDFPGAFETYAADINDAGQITGQYNDGVRDHAFLYTGGAYFNIDVPGSLETRAVGINNHGDVVGDYGTQQVGRTPHGFLLRSGLYRTIDIPGSFSTDPNDVADSGVVVGVFNNGSTHGFVEQFDFSPPTTTAALNGPQGSNGWYTDPVQVTLSATDPDGPADVAATYYTLDGAAQQTYAGPFTVLPDGPHTLNFFSVDQAGNAEPPNSLAFKIDATPPKVFVGVSRSVLPPNGAMVPVTVAALITDAGSGVDPNSAAYSVVDDYGVVQPSGPASIFLSHGHYYLTFTVQLEAKPREGDSARKYRITVNAADLAGNAGVGGAVVTAR